MQWSPAIFIHIYKLLNGIIQDKHTPPHRILGCKEVLEWSCIQQMHNWDAVCKAPQTVIGADVRRSITFASTPIIIGGLACNVPVIVHHCIEALQRKVEPLLRDPPDETQCTNLATAFNSGPSYGVHIDLAHPAQDAASTFWILVHYVEKLPFALVYPALVHPLEMWCVNPSRIRVQQHEVVKAQYAELTASAADSQKTGTPDAWLQPRKCNVNPTDAVIREEETKQVAIAALLLRLLPPSMFVLLVYLMDFLLQACTRPEYEITVQEIVDTFANKLVRGDDHALSEQIFLWLLTRWPEISGLLFQKSTSEYEARIERGYSPVDAPDEDAQPEQSQAGQELHEHAQRLHTCNAELARQKKHAHEALRTACTEEQVCLLSDLITALGTEKDLIGVEMNAIQNRIKAEN